MKLDLVCIIRYAVCCGYYINNGLASGAGYGVRGTVDYVGGGPGIQFHWRRGSIHRALTGIESFHKILLWFTAMLSCYNIQCLSTTMILFVHLNHTSGPVGPSGHIFALQTIFTSSLPPLLTYFIKHQKLL
jgi:hypothetical protein